MFRVGRGFGVGGLPMGPRRGRPGTAYAVALLFQLWSKIADLPHKPPVTLSLILLNLAVFGVRYVSKLPAEQVRHVLPSTTHAVLRRLGSSVSVRNACLQPARVLRNGERYRLVLSSFVHLDEVHLLWNMLSFLHKGVTLESQLGTYSFAALVTLLSFLSHSFYVLIAVIASRTGLYARPMNACVAGFSGVLFGLGAILTSSRQYRDAAQVIFGFSVPKAGVSVLMELVTVQLFIPSASFLGHLCGVLAGFSFVLVSRLLLWRPSTYSNFGSGIVGRAHQD